MLPAIELSIRPGIVEFGWGHPDPALLPVDAIARATALALERDGVNALAYGALQGSGPLIERICARLERLEGHAPDPAQLLITGGASQGIDLICTMLTRPGDVVLVESPTYHLALKILLDHGLELVPVPADEQGLRIDWLAATLATLRARGKYPRLLYSVPTFSNPSGASLALERRVALIDLAQREGLIVLEDDVYRELWYDTPAPTALFNLAPAGSVIRFGSFAKILAPGLRLGWLLADPGIVQRCANGGLLDSGGGQSQFAAQVLATLIDLGLLDAHVATLRATYRQRRNVLLATLADALPAACSWETPQGGYFVWVCLPEGMDSTALLPAALAAGVAYIPGARFHHRGDHAAGAGETGTRYLRLCFTLLPPEQLAEGARRLGQVIREKSAEG